MRQSVGGRRITRNMDTEMATTNPLVSLPDAIFGNILEYLDWGDVGRLDTGNRQSVNTDQFLSLTRTLDTTQGWINQICLNVVGT